jgi:hypothetical protein
MEVDLMTLDARRFASFVRAAAGAAAIVLLSGCAALFAPDPQPVPVDTRPPGAGVYVDGEYRGTTPLTLELDGRATHDVTLRLDDQERTIQLTSSVGATWVALDVVPGLALAGASFAVASTGSGYVDSFGELLAVFGGGVGMAIGAGSAAVAVGVDAATGRWYRLSPGDIVVEFTSPEPAGAPDGGS